MTPLRRFAHRAPAFVHTLLVMSSGAFIFAAYRETHDHLPVLVWDLGGPLLLGLMSRVWGEAVGRSWPTKPAKIQPTLRHLQDSLHVVVHDSINRLAGMQGELDLILHRIDRLREAVARLESQSRETEADGGTTT